MKKLFLTAVLLFSTTASADELTAWKNGFYQGAEAGYKLCQVETKEKLKSYEDLITSVFNTKALMFAGRFPLPTAYQKIKVVRKPDGTAEIVRKWEVLPPAYFPVSAIESLKQELTSGTSFIPTGWGVVLSTANLPVEKIAYAYYAGTKLGEVPVYLPDFNLLVLGTFHRKADAENLKSQLLSFGVEAQLEKIEKPIVVKNTSSDLSSILLNLAEKMKSKEEELLGIKTRRDSMDYLISAVDRALASARLLEDNPTYKDFDFLKLEKDLESIKDNVLSYLYDREPYKRVVLEDPFAEREKTYEQTISKLKAEVEKLKAENERLKLLVGKKQKLQTDSSVIKKYLRGEL